jgi:hypothetical protein
MSISFLALGIKKPPSLYIKIYLSHIQKKETQKTGSIMKFFEIFAFIVRAFQILAYLFLFNN